MKHIVLCSNHPILIAGFRHVIESSGEFSLSVCQDPTMLREQIPAHRAHMVVIDVTSEATMVLLADLAAIPGTPVILWLDNAGTEFISQAIGVGVMGILRKNSEFGVCLDCLRKVAAGALWIEPELSNMLLRTRKVKLTPRERQLMTMLAQGYRNKELAYRLGITEGTVKVYLSRLYEKVGVGDRFELALMALKNLACDQTTASKSLAAASSVSARPFLMPGFLSVKQPAAVFVH